MSDNSVIKCQGKKHIDVTQELSGDAEAAFYLGTFSSLSFWNLDGLSDLCRNWNSKTEQQSIKTIASCW